ncbi:MAG: aminotransferase class V-fold PLP-dependent enzyme [Bdellovibrionales bacterium]|nr:aminotransferase class V-fold PLP-dependent enzyme [Bdellovibrionales bacterium]
MDRSPHLTPRSLRNHLPPSDKLVHLNNAGLGPLTRAAVERAAEIAALQAERGSHAIAELLQICDNARRSFARLVNADPELVCFSQTCAASISQVALGISLRPGDEIVRWDQEYPSNAIPWHRAAELAGATVTVVPSEAGYQLSTERLLHAISTRTRVVTVSWVQFQTGAITDLTALSNRTKEVGAWLVVDAIQGLGVIPFDMEAFGVDAVCGGSHKWLLGPLGLGFLALAPHRLEELKPVLHGAGMYGPPLDVIDLNRPLPKNARRFEPGIPQVLAAGVAAASADTLLSVGIDSIYGIAASRASALRAQLETDGSTVLHNDPVDGITSPITTFFPRCGLEQAERALQREGIAYTPRAGGIRLSPHGFNTEEEIERAAKAIRTAGDR